jgi:hypothetical protein
LRKLAEARPDFVPAEPEGPSLLERAARTPEPFAADSAHTPAQFSAALAGRIILQGNYHLIGRLPRASADAAPSELLVFATGGPRRERLLAFAVDAPDPPVWDLTFERVRSGQGAELQHAVLPGAIVVPGNRGLVAVDPRDGEVLWTRDLQGMGLLSLTGESGVVIADVTSLAEGERLIALDARHGVELWSLPLSPEFHSTPVVSAQHVVLLPRQAAQQRLEVRDLFTGRLGRDVALDSDVSEPDLRGAWIQDGLLVLPSSRARARRRPI